MKKVGLIERFRISALDPHSYKKLMKDNMWKAILFIFVIAIIFDGLPFLNDARAVLKEKKIIMEFIEDNNLSIAVQDKQLVKPEKPIDDSSLNTRIYINKDITYDEANKGDLKGESTYLGLFKDRMVMKVEGTSQELDYSMLKDFSLNENELASNLSMMISIAIVIIGIYILLSQFIGYLMNGFVLSAVASIASLFSRKIIRLGELYKCGLYALTLPIIFCSILQLLKVPIYSGYFFYIQIIAGGIYAIVAIRNYEPDNKENVIQ